MQIASERYVFPVPVGPGIKIWNIKFRDLKNSKIDSSLKSMTSSCLISVNLNLLMSPFSVAYSFSSSKLFSIFKIWTLFLNFGSSFQGIK